MLKTDKRGYFQLSCGCQITAARQSGRQQDCRLGQLASYNVIEDDSETARQSFYCGIYHDKLHRPANEQRIIETLKKQVAK